MQERKLSMSFGTAFIVGAGFALGATIISAVIWIVIVLIMGAIGFALMPFAY
ncbi:MAG: hypothetical protein SV910_03475 [Chloroflexota bacterium]|nr:hypothetical protein [Chloroflexota bacterium]